MHDRDAQLRALLDKQEITEVLVRYSRGADRADVDLIRSCYHADATEDHGGVFKGRAMDYVDSIAKVINKFPVITHAISNILIELKGQTAEVEAYITTFCRLKKEGELFDTLTLARVLDTFQQRNGAWKIAARRLTWEWQHEMPMRETWGRGMMAPDPSVLVRGAKKPNDRLYTGQ